jgi:predicted AlkP superfamily pyrophosphatase or phosphodiesterase
MKKYSNILILLAFSTIAFLFACTKDPEIPVNKITYKTKNVVVVIVDGARYTETWGLASRQFIPNRNAMLQDGVMCSSFYNNGYCFTNAGHSAITTGVYQFINNSGMELPQNPSFFQYWLKDPRHASSEAWVVATKDKLAILSDCLDPKWQGQFRPSTDCGVAGLGTGYREDSTTFIKVKNIFTMDHPRLMLINFKQPDAAGHMNDSAAYLQGIVDTDNYIYQLWQYLQTDPFYRDKTTLIVTNDHGRHTAGHLDGFVSHTDNCDGCKHIEFFGIGPDFKESYICNKPYEQIDIAATVAELMGFYMPTSNGKVIRDVFK